MTATDKPDSPNEASDDTLRAAFPDFAGRFATLRSEKKMSLAALTKETSLARPTLTRLAAGDTNPRLVNVAKVANALGVSLYTLLGSPAQAEDETAPKPDAAAAAFLARPPLVDTRTYKLYERLVHGASLESTYDEIREQRLSLPGEDVETALIRLTLDLFHAKRVSIDPFALRRSSRLEQKVADRLQLRKRSELRDRTPVRVVELPDHFPPILRTLAIGAMAAEVLRELLGTYRTLGFSDGFTTAALQLFLSRGDLYRAEAVPLVFTPQHVQYELSGATLVGSLLRTHLGYDIKSTVELGDLRRKLGHVEVAVMSCGSAVRDHDARIRRVISEAHPDEDYEAFEQTLKHRGVVGDLMYHFLDRKGHEVRIGGSSRDFSDVHKYRMRHLKPGDPVIFSAALSTLHDITRRGVSMLLVPSADRAAVCHAATRRSKAPINFVVMDRQAAEATLALP